VAVLLKPLLIKEAMLGHRFMLLAIKQIILI